jgi:hypothetical protein
MTLCFIDRDYRATPAEREGWATFLTMPASCMKAARGAFREVHDGGTSGEAFLAFMAGTGLDDEPLLARLETALQGLAEERRKEGALKSEDTLHTVGASP